MQKKILINASNLHDGGGVQVAASFISDLACLGSDFSISVWASTKVNKNVQSLNANITRFDSYEVIDSYGWRFLFSEANRNLSMFDIVFTVFGPCYSMNRSVTKITGFAQPSLIYPQNEIQARYGFLQGLVANLKSRVQKFFYTFTDVYVVELEHVRRQLAGMDFVKRQPIEVVHNCVSPIFFTPDLWKPVEIPATKAVLKLGFVGRNYPHKNTSIFPDIKRILFEKYDVDAELFVTFRNDEWDACSDEFRRTIKNVGELSLAQCPSFYMALDAVVFPSYLECFSATPLEAMIMRKPLFASDRAFNRDVCDDFAFYFDPTSAESAAAVIFERFKNSEFCVELDAAHAYARNFSSSASRTHAYMELIRRFVK